MASMVKTGVVNAQGLRLRSAPSLDSEIIKSLNTGTPVQILDQEGDFFKVSVGGQVGFVKADLIKVNQGAAAPAPAGTTNTAAGTFRFEGNAAIAPDGTRFATRKVPGVFNIGQTTIGQFLRDNSDMFADVAPSRLRVMQAVSKNEGMLEAINTFDGAFLSFGIFQWTAGVADDPGELPPLLVRLKQKDQSVFNNLFGRFGLDATALNLPPGEKPVGFFSLNGVPIRKAADKEKSLRTLEWAFRFFQAGHDDTIRQVEIEHAMGRVDLFYRSARHQINGRPIADYLSSEYGVAIVLDEHVNAPAHVPGTLAGAVNQLIAEGAPANPATWTDALEQKLVQTYIQRRNNTRMTDPKGRADRITQAVAAGLASGKRGSYQDTLT
jgi:hypothetical protein